MTTDTYLNLCTQVYDLSKPTPPEDAYAFYRSYATEAKGPILEPMCGSGRFLIPLLEDGFDVQGFDASQHMLDALKQKANDKKLSPSIWKGTIQELNQKERYDLIFIPAGSFSLMTNMTEVKASLQAMYAHLQSKGILLFEVETSKAVPEPRGIWRGSIWDCPNHQKIVANYCSSIKEDICTVIARYELVDTGKIIQTEIEEYRIKLYDDTTKLIELLRSVGFSQINLRKAFDREQQPQKDDESIVLECIK